MKHITGITDQFKDELIKRIDKAKRIAISSHVSPDDDSISSVLAVYYYLTEIKDKDNVHIIYTGKKTDKWEYFKNFDQIVFVEDLAEYVNDLDLLILLDGSNWERFSNKPKPENLSGKIVCIDHHPFPKDLFNLHLVAIQYPAASEIVYRLLFEQEKNLSKEICEILLLGIIGDTGNFRYLKPEQSDTLLIANRLIDEGNIYIDDLKTQYESMSEKVYKTLSELMKNSEVVEIENWPKVMTATLGKEYIEEHVLEENDIKEAAGIFTSYLRAIEGVLWGFVITYRLDGGSHLSFRSSPGSVNVNILATVFNGGGHVRASGGKIDDSDVNNAKEKIFQWMRENKPVLG